MPINRAYTISVAGWFGVISSDYNHPCLLKHCMYAAISGEYFITVCIADDGAIYISIGGATSIIEMSIVEGTLGSPATDLESHTETSSPQSSADNGGEG